MSTATRTETDATFSTVASLLRSEDDGRADEARRIIRKEYGDSENFMTPNVVGYLMLGANVAAEVSTGSGFRRDDGSRPVLVGVSVARENDDGSTDRLTGVSGVLIAPTVEEVREQIQELRETV